MEGCEWFVVLSLFLVSRPPPTRSPSSTNSALWANHCLIILAMKALLLPLLLSILALFTILVSNFSILVPPILRLIPSVDV